MKPAALLVRACVALALVAGATACASPIVTNYKVEVIERVPHDPTAFTEGLLFDAKGRLFESVGLEGSSSIREVDPKTGKVLREVKLADDQFGEGIAITPDGDELVQLTWKSGVALRWDIATFEQRGTFSYKGEGWGLTSDGRRFIQSDGSSTLRVRNATTFDELSSVKLTVASKDVDQINELEFVGGAVFSNVWHSDRILRFDPATGEANGTIDASQLWDSPKRTKEMTLNGIAHRPGDELDELWLTGKNWPEMFHVRLVEVDE